MIRQLRGELWHVGPGEAVIGAGGVGYRVFLPVSAAARLPALGERVVLHIHTHLREDALQLFGFLESDHLRLFEQLIEVNGVGPRLALAVLSHLEPKAFVEAVQTGNVSALTRVPGIGKKTAERLIVELRDRLPAHAASPAAGPATELEAALLALGYTVAEVRAVCAQLSLDGVNLAVALKQALALLRPAADRSAS